MCCDCQHAVAANCRVANGTDGTFLSETIGAYLAVLTRLMVTEDLPAWMPGLRSRARLRAAPVRHLADPSLAAAALNVQPDTPAPGDQLDGIPLRVVGRS